MTPSEIKFDIDVLERKLEYQKACGNTNMVKELSLQISELSKMLPGYFCVDCD